MASLRATATARADTAAGTLVPLRPRSISLPASSNTAAATTSTNPRLLTASSRTALPRINTVRRPVNTEAMTSTSSSTADTTNTRLPASSTNSTAGSSSIPRPASTNNTLRPASTSSIRLRDNNNTAVNRKDTASLPRDTASRAGMADSRKATVVARRLRSGNATVCREPLFIWENVSCS